MIEPNKLKTKTLLLPKGEGDLKAKKMTTIRVTTPIKRLRFQKEYSLMNVDISLDFECDNS